MPGRRTFFVYILASMSNRALYPGVTCDPTRRTRQHRCGVPGRCSGRYAAYRLLWYEMHESPTGAVRREQQIKAGCRRHKVDLIEGRNSGWRDRSRGW
jgi:putative endonuclease